MVKVKLTLHSSQLTKEELQHLIQSIRDCEQIRFPDKELSIWIEVPELTRSECAEILTSIKPPYKYGPTTTGLISG
ncbi:unnamed protein product [marine sediment metagenome]|uniref:Uncharacterized protein n=1 Tax=marine sediment metagenome TaxID=412755 RepID=X1NGK1_9ZZZZ